MIVVTYDDGGTAMCDTITQEKLIELIESETCLSIIDTQSMMVYIPGRWKPIEEVE